MNFRKIVRNSKLCLQPPVLRMQIYVYIYVYLYIYRCVYVSRRPNSSSVTRRDSAVKERKSRKKNRNRAKEKPRLIIAIGVICYIKKKTLQSEEQLINITRWGGRLARSQTGLVAYYTGVSSPCTSNPRIRDIDKRDCIHVYTSLEA